MKLPILVAIVFTSVFASAEESWTGFKLAEQVQINPSEYINNSVVMVRTVGGTSSEYQTALKMVDMQSEPPLKNKQKLNHKFDKQNPHNAMNEIQKETCRKQGLRMCPVFSISAISSGFFKQGRSLNMCRHSFHNWLVLASKANNRELDTLSPPMIIFSKDKEVLYNSALVSDDKMIKVSYLNFDDRLNNEIYKYNDQDDPLSFNFNFSDYIQFDSPVEIVPGMDMNFVTNFKKLKKGLRVYMAGYPGATDFFSGEQGEAPGFELVVSTGKISGVWQKELAVQVNAMSYGGMSGGPILFEDGSVLGLVCFGEGPKKDQPETASATALVMDRQALEKLWEGLNY